MRILSTIGASAVSHPEHGIVTADADGTFEVSEELGMELTEFPHWEAEPAATAATFSAVGVAEDAPGPVVDVTAPAASDDAPAAAEAAA